ncbi:MAG: hypothetical protein ACLTSG_07960 [Lachnospiraceae bacterium]
MARRRQGGKKRGSLVGTLVFALALLLMWLGSELGLVSWGGGGPGAELVTTPPPEDALFAAFIDVGQGDSARLLRGRDAAHRRRHQLCGRRCGGLPALQGRGPARLRRLHPRARGPLRRSGRHHRGF